MVRTSSPPLEPRRRIEQLGGVEPRHVVVEPPLPGSRAQAERGDRDDVLDGQHAPAVAIAGASTEPRYDVRHHVQHRLYEAGKGASMGRVRRGLGLGHRGTAHLRAGRRLPRQGRRGRGAAPRGGRVDAYRAGCGGARRLRRSLRPRRATGCWPPQRTGSGTKLVLARRAGRLRDCGRRPRRALHQRRLDDRRRAALLPRLRGGRAGSTWSRWPSSSRAPRRSAGTPAARSWAARPPRCPASTATRRSTSREPASASSSAQGSSTAPASQQGDAVLGLASARPACERLLARSLAGRRRPVRCRPAARPHALLSGRCPAPARAVRRPRARPRDRRRAFRQPGARSADGARGRSSTRPPGSVRLCSPGSMLRACPRRSNGACSISGSGTARSCRRTTRASRGCPSSGGSRPGSTASVFA